METRLSTRVAALTGLGYVALAVVGNDVLGDPSPSSAASTAEIGAWARDLQPTTATWAAGLLEVVALLMFAVFVVILGSALRADARDSGWLATLVVCTGSVSAGIKLASAAPAFALLHRAGSQSDELAAALVDMNSAAFFVTWALDAVLLAAAGAVIVRTRRLPRMLGWAAIAIAPLLLASVAGADTGPPVFLLALLWFIAASLTLALRGARAPRTAMA